MIAAGDQLPHAGFSGSTARSATDGVEGCFVAVESSLRHYLVWFFFGRLNHHIGRRRLPSVASHQARLGTGDRRLATSVSFRTEDAFG